MKKIVTLCMSLLLMFSLAGCNDAATNDNIKTREAGNRLQEQQSTPTDLDFSLERYNLIRRAYWVNGQREKAAGVVCQVEKPLGYIVLFTESGGVVGRQGQQSEQLPYSRFYLCGEWKIFAGRGRLLRGERQRDILLYS